MKGHQTNTFYNFFRVSQLYQARQSYEKQKSVDKTYLHYKLRYCRAVHLTKWTVNHLNEIKLLV